MSELFDWLLKWLTDNQMLDNERSLFYGQFIDDGKLTGLKTKFVINSTSGSVGAGDVRYPRFRVSAIGYKNNALIGNSAYKKVEEDLEKLLNHIQTTRDFPCGYGNIRAVTTINGPTFTADNRVVYTLDIELLK